MAAIEDEPLDGLAGEFVLGTLDSDERRAFLRRMAREPEAVVAVGQWQARLTPLALALEEIAPPPHLIRRIEEGLDEARASAPAPAPANDNFARPWQLATLAASLVALVATGLAFRGEQRITPVPAPIVAQPVSLNATAIAALSAKGETPGMFVTYDRVTGKLRVVPVNLTPDAAHSLELWLIAGKDAPKPMGLIDAAKTADRRVGQAMAGGSTLAVSVEPVGGSPTGLPTGPVIYSGALVEMRPPT